MKNTTIALSLSLILAACGGGGGHSGSTGPQGAPGKSAYDIWLEQGNTGTEQDFLDSLVSDSSQSGGSESGTPNENEPGTSNEETNDFPKHFINTKEYINYITTRGSDYYDIVENDKEWPTHEGYKEYSYRYDAGTNQTTGTAQAVYNEKELKLGNYGVYIINSKSDFDTDFDNGYPQAYIHNRYGAGINVYTPNEESVFKGGTLAYLHTRGSSSSADAEFIKGDATFTYNPTNPKLDLEFENYYNIEFQKTSDVTSSDYTFIISGSNSTGKQEYDLPTGQFEHSRAYIRQTRGFVKKDRVEEAFGTYNINFLNFGKTKSDFDLTGAFGSTKQ